MGLGVVLNIFDLVVFLCPSRHSVDQGFSHASVAKARHGTTYRRLATKIGEILGLDNFLRGDNHTTRVDIQVVAAINFNAPENQ
jgi:hypothetical protein